MLYSCTDMATMGRQRVNRVSGAVQVLGLANTGSEVDVVAELRGRLEAAGLMATSSSMAQEGNEAMAAAVAAETAKYEATIAELKTNNDSLKAKLKAVYKSSQDWKQRHARDVAKLQKTVVELQQQKAREQQAAEVERVSGEQAVGGGDVSGKAEDTTAGGVVLPPVNVTSSQARPSLVTSTSTGDREHNNSAAPVVMPPLMLPKTSPTSTPRQAPPTTAVVLPNLAYQSNVDQQSPSSLHSQVGHFALLSLTL